MATGQRFLIFLTGHQDHIVQKYKEKHPKLLASEPKASEIYCFDPIKIGWKPSGTSQDYPGARILEAGLLPPFFRARKMIHEGYDTKFHHVPSTFGCVCWFNFQVFAYYQGETGSSDADPGTLLRFVEEKDGSKFWVLPGIQPVEADRMWHHPTDNDIK